jgi:RIO kinase 3
MDRNTRLLVFKMLNSGQLTEVNGAISTGKEAVVFHGRGILEADGSAPQNVEVAIKVFKTTLTEFTQRQQFLHGDRRFEDRVGRQHARKLVKLWAEKEMANLTRMHRAGMACPQVVLLRKHVLVMTFLGHDGVAAPKLKVSDGWWRSASGVARNVGQGWSALAGS